MKRLEWDYEGPRLRSHLNLRVDEIQIYRRSVYRLFDNLFYTRSENIYTEVFLDLPVEI